MKEAGRGNMQRVRAALGAANRNKMMLIINSSAALIKDLFLQHMQKVKVTTLWNFCWLPHLFIIASLDAGGKNSGFWNNVCGRWSLQSCSLALSQLDSLGETFLVQSFPFNCIQRRDEPVQEKLLCSDSPLKPLRHFEVEFFPWFLGPEKLLGFFPLSLPFPPFPREKKENIHTHAGALYLST